MKVSEMWCVLKIDGQEEINISDKVSLDPFVIEDRLEAMKAVVDLVQKSYFSGDVTNASLQYNTRGQMFFETDQWKIMFCTDEFVAALEKLASEKKYDELTFYTLDCSVFRFPNL